MSPALVDWHDDGIYDEISDLTRACEVARASMRNIANMGISMTFIYISGLWSLYLAHCEETRRICHLICQLKPGPSWGKGEESLPKSLLEFTGIKSLSGCFSPSSRANPGW